MNDGILTSDYQLPPMPRGLLGSPTPVPMIDARRVFDPDAERYIAAVERADGMPLEQAVRNAVRNFVLGCKEDGIWSKIKASCILMGARTLAGALTPLVGAAPTNNNFVTGDYNRKTGVVGNAATKSLNSNRSNTADQESNHHISVYLTAQPNRDCANAGLGDFSGGQVQLLNANGGYISRHRNLTVFLTSPVNGLFGASRSVSSSYQHRANRSTSTANIAVSGTPLNFNYHIFGRTASSGFAESFTNARLAFYSIGESLALDLLDNRVSALANAIGAAIP